MQRSPGATGGRRIDLHTHTRLSDGALSPAELVERALDRRVAALSITDHDSIAALPLARAAAAGRLELVPGIEISSGLEGLDLHVLGFFVDPAHEELARSLERFRGERRERVGRIVERLAEVGAAVDLDQVLELAGEGVVGRPHVAEVLVRGGHAENLEDAFRRLLGQRGLAFVPRPAFHPREAIALIHGAGGVSVLAHPGGGLADAVIEELVGEGLRGIEVWHPQHGPSAVRRYRRLAGRFGLLETGGSDFHAPGRGADLGDMPVPPGVLAALKQAAGVTG